MNAVYNPRIPHGGGYRTITITGPEGPVVLKNLKEKLLAAKIIQAHLILRVSRQDAEVAAAIEVLRQRKTRRWFGRTK